MTDDMKARDVRSARAKEILASFRTIRTRGRGVAVAVAWVAVT